MNHPCLTWFNDSFRVTRLMINGLKQAPESIEGEKKLIIKDDNISIELNYSKLSIDKNRYIVDLKDKRCNRHLRKKETWDRRCQEKRLRWKIPFFYE